MPPCRLRRSKILKIWPQNGAIWCDQHSAVLCTCLPWLLSKYNINIKNCSCCMFSLVHFPGVSADTICPWERTPMVVRCTRMVWITIIPGDFRSRISMPGFRDWKRGRDSVLRDCNRQLDWTGSGPETLDGFVLNDGVMLKCVDWFSRVSLYDRLGWDGW